MKSVESLGVFRVQSRPKFLFILAVSAVVLSIGGSLAANITLNGDATPNSLAFGQGVVAATSCDTEVKLSAKARYINSESRFYLSQIVLGGISSDCLGKTFTINGFTTGSDTAIPFSTTVGHPEITVYFRPSDPANPALPGTFTVSSTDSSTTLAGSWSLVTDAGNSSTDNGFTLSLDPANKIRANDLDTLTIENGN